MGIYLGPGLLAPAWWLVLRKIIRVCRQQRLTSIADFISARYGKSASPGGAGDGRVRAGRSALHLLANQRQ
ncbi:MAG: hypothetical protein WKG07_16990 [Hymenobacter sp.]